MKRSSIYIISTLLILSSCGFGGDKNPCREIMGKDKFVEVMTEVYLIEAYLETLILDENELKDSIILYYNSLFVTYNIDKNTLTDAIDCYLLERDLAVIIHDEILSSIILMEDKDAGQVE